MLVANGLNIVFTPCPEYKAVTARQNKDRDFLTLNDAGGIRPRLTTEALLADIYEKREDLLKIIFSEVSEALTTANVGRNTADITTAAMTRVFENFVSNKNLSQKIQKIKDLVLPAYCSSWKDVAWRLTQQLLAYGYGRRGSTEQNLMFSYETWRKAILAIPLEIIKNHLNVNIEML